MADNRRLIDANTLYDELSTLSVFVTGIRAGKGVLTEYMKEYRKSVLRVIDEQRTVDAVEVVHGRWIEKQEPIPWCDDDVDMFWECSVCECRNFGESPYCPNCGAKMDGDGNA